METSSNIKNKEEVLKLSPEWPYRLFGTVVVLSIITFLCIIVITIKDELVSKQIDIIKNNFYNFTSQHGFLIDDILIDGRNRTSKEEIFQAVNINRSDNVIKVDLTTIKNNLEALPWVQNATIKRTFFPNLIHISIKEKNVRAVWQHQEKFYPIDSEGNIINADFRTHEPVLLIVGNKAPENLKGLLNSIYNSDKKYYQRIKVANFISERRWDLILDDIENGITIKLPEKEPQEAWKKLLKLNETKGLLKRKLTIIDLRLPDKIIVKLRKSSSETTPLNKNKEHKL